MEVEVSLVADKRDVVKVNARARPELRVRSTQSTEHLQLSTRTWHSPSPFSRPFRCCSLFLESTPATSEVAHLLPIGSPRNPNLALPTHHASCAPSFRITASTWILNVSATLLLTGAIMHSTNHLARLSREFFFC